MDTLLTIMKDRYGLTVDPDSDGGQILGSLRPQPPFGVADLSGTAQVPALTLSPKADGGVTIRAAAPDTALVLNVPFGDLEFTLSPMADGTVEVDITLVAPKMLIPGLRPARPADAESLEVMLEADGVRVVLPRVLLHVVARPNKADAEASLAPSQDAAGALEAVLEPPHAFFGPDAVLGLHMPRATLNLGGPSGAVLGSPSRKTSSTFVPAWRGACASSGSL